MGLLLWLRAETKKNEQRTALTPSICKTLIANGFEINVEESADRIFKDSEYVEIGCKLVPHGSWRTAPASALIIGLKELPENDFTPLTHTHIMFAHCFKRQGGWMDVLGRFKNGNGTLLDLEFLTNEQGRRVAAFGYYAGFAGAALGVDLWAHNILNPGKTYPSVTPFDNENDLIKHVTARLNRAVEIAGRKPSVMVMGALGRCGTGASDFASKVGIPDDLIIKWDMAETKKGGPFEEILQHDIFVNSIYLSLPIPPFIYKEQLDNPGRKLNVVVDVSCDTTNPHNPIPIYNQTTTFDEPVLTVQTKTTPVDVIAIDHLPTLLPREASEFFGADLLPSLLALPERTTAPVWANAEKLYHDKVKEMEAEQEK
ncbi:Saccharopine dehydrogenase [Nowakowskiella sp. JEL0407]|nr:Saccharopine dehydrogenase [Nowakowskiella sp. JEL0407]